MSWTRIRIYSFKFYARKPQHVADDTCLLLPLPPPLLVYTQMGHTFQRLPAPFKLPLTTLSFRTLSIREALLFAKAAKLPGIVSNALPLVRCPEIIRYIKSSGLLLLTYGGISNDPEAVLIQVLPPRPRFLCPAPLSNRSLPILRVESIREAITALLVRCMGLPLASGGDCTADN